MLGKYGTPKENERYVQNLNRKSWKKAYKINSHISEDNIKMDHKGIRHESVYDIELSRCRDQ
jgi:hypothetical protein